MFRLSRVVLHLSQPMFPSRERMKQRRYRKLLLFASRDQEFPVPDPSSNADDQLEPLPFVSDTTLNNGLFKRSESVSDVGRMIDVTFRVHLADARDERVFLFGDSHEFGKWRTEDAFSLRWTPGDIWTGQLRLQPGTYEFKIIRVRDGKEVLENGENRVLVIDERPSAGSEMEVTMEFGKTLSSNAVKIIRETIVLGENGHELYRVPGELHKLKQTPDPNSVVGYFKSVLQLDEKDIESLFQQRLSLKSMSVDLEIKPWVEYLRQEVKSPYSWIGALIKRNPKLLNVPVEKLAPVVEFLLYDIGVPVKRLRRFLEQSYTWHYINFEEKFKPRIENLRQFTGLKGSELGVFCVKGIRLLSLNEETWKQQFEDLGAIFNLSNEDFVKFVIRYPKLLSLKPHDVAQKLDYMAKELNRSLGDIVQFPVCLEYNADKRIKERFEYLKQIGIPHSSYSLREILQPTDEAFNSMVQRRLED